MPNDLYRTFEMRLALTSVLAGAAALAITSSVVFATSPTGSVFRDPVVTAARSVALGTGRVDQPIIALSRLDDGTRHRLVAAGLRGLILVSDDNGATWTQARVPVQSDLVALYFAPSGQGWAVGHDGVILHSDDRGANWTKQFDGAIGQRTLLPYYQARIDKGEKSLEPFAAQVALNTKDGPTLPYLSIYFQNDRVGYAVGSFGMLLASGDGGRTWQPWLDHIDNPNFLNLNDIREIAGDVYIAGEQGGVYRLDRDQHRFINVSPSYKGSFFHIVGNAQYLMVVGLNGTAFRSTDRGQSWTAVNTGATTSLTSAALSSDGRTLMLTAEGGQLLYSQDGAQTFRHLRPSTPMLFADIVADGGDDFVLAGYQGIERASLKPARPVTPHQK